MALGQTTYGNYPQAEWCLRDPDDVTQGWYSYYSRGIQLQATEAMALGAPNQGTGAYPPVRFGFSNVENLILWAQGNNISQPDHPISSINGVWGGVGGSYWGVANGGGVTNIPGCVNCTGNYFLGMTQGQFKNEFKNETNAYQNLSPGTGPINGLFSPGSENYNAYPRVLSSTYGNQFNDVCTCTSTPVNVFNCIERQDLSGDYVSLSSCENDTSSPCGDPCSYSGWANVVTINAADIDCISGEARVDVAMDSSATFWNVEYEHIGSGVVTTDPTTYTFSGSSNFLGDSINATVSLGDWKATVTDSNGCFEILLFSITCNPPLGNCNYGPNWIYDSVDGPNTSPHDISVQVSAATNTACDDGQLGISIDLFGNGATSITEIILYENSTNWTVLNIDTNPSFTFVSGTYYSTLTTGLSSVSAPDLPYIFKVTDDLGCIYYYESYLPCSLPYVSFNCAGIHGETAEDAQGNLFGIAPYTCYDPIANNVSGVPIPGVYTGPTALADCQSGCRPCDDNLSHSDPGPFGIQPTIGNSGGITPASMGNCGLQTGAILNTGGDGSVQVTMWNANAYTGSATQWKITYYYTPVIGPAVLIYDDPVIYNVASAFAVSANPLINMSGNAPYAYYITVGSDSSGVWDGTCDFGPYPFQVPCTQPDNWMCEEAAGVFGCYQTALSTTNTNVFSTLAACQNACNPPVNNWFCGHGNTCTPTSSPTSLPNVYSTLAACQIGCVSTTSGIVWTGCTNPLFPGFSMGEYNYVGPNNMICANDPDCTGDPAVCGVTYEHWVGCGNSNAPGGPGSAYNVIGPNGATCAGDPFCHPVCGPPGNISLMYPAGNIPASWNMAFNWGNGGCDCDPSELGCNDSFVGTTYNGMTPVC